MNLEMPQAVTLWLGLVKVYTGRLDCLLDPIVHREELRELCRQFLGRVALSYSADGFENPAAAIALEAQADPLLQGNSTDVHLQLLEEQSFHHGWQIAHAVATLARLQHVPLGRMVESLVEGTRCFWGEEPSCPLLLDSKALCDGR